ncbi:hypothetical protein L3556_14420 [Candidatus Synechococcus calcipolaris G9]|uniref:Transposase n=1 Tax=Candidatus Synechococcus calcipolaris G9 TaxID=1497997 RepID=A0ABT6F2L9_9SYNE|nr:hypothetical protein [Candidatus Synechococcus calcipolaris]MDG2992115.1 hypothetical protein [Candidatus Synechococcus calcipolaris G9]
MAGKGKPGNRSKLSAGMVDKLVDIIGQGHFQATAAKVVGIHKATLSEWLRVGREQGTGLQGELYSRLKDAEAQAEQAALSVILSDDDWKSKAWFLERRFPQRWCLQSRIENEAERQLKDMLSLILNNVTIEAKTEIVQILTGTNLLTCTKDTDAMIEGAFG